MQRFVSCFKQAEAQESMAPELSFSPPLCKWFCDIQGKVEECRCGHRAQQSFRSKCTCTCLYPVFHLQYTSFFLLPYILINLYNLVFGTLEGIFHHSGNHINLVNVIFLLRFLRKILNTQHTLLPLLPYQKLLSHYRSSLLFFLPIYY